ncbi:MAG: phosphatidylserine decarboxylase family protein [Nitrospirae bacterium]|nr:phosphatidylserine decarboxylase family protein [Nitrospirota bacterium]
MIKFAPEGYPFILSFLGLTILMALFTPLGALLPFVLTLFMACFFRDPERTVPEGENIFVAPADGKVILISLNPPIPPLLRGGKGGLREGEGFIEISIFMSPLNVHVNRAPSDGVVESVVHTPGKFLSAFKHEASLHNENIAMVLDTKHGRVLVRQVAGFLARRAVCRVKPGDSLRKGQRYGIIKFSSRLDIYLPKDTHIKVKLGDRVKAGETVIGEI